MKPFLGVVASLLEAGNDVDFSFVSSAAPAGAAKIRAGNLNRKVMNPSLVASKKTKPRRSGITENCGRPVEKSAKVYFCLHFRSGAQETTPPLPSNYPAFSAPMYSIDVFLPIADFHQEGYWLPGKTDGLILWAWRYKIWLWLEILFGCFLTTIAVAGLTELVKKD